MQLTLPTYLKDLRGRLYGAYRVALPVLLCLGLVGLGSSYRANVEDMANSRAFYALDLINTVSDAQGTWVQGFQGPLRHAIPRQELLSSIDGKTLPTDPAAQTRLLSGPEDAVVGMELQRSDGSRHVATVRRSASYLRDGYAGSGLTFASRRWLQYACAVLPALMALGVACLLYLRRPRDPVAAMLSIGLACMVLGAFGSGLLPDLLVLSVVVQTAASVGLFGGLLFFPDARLRSRWSWAVIALLLLATAIGSTSARYPVLGSISSILNFAALAGVALAFVARYRGTPPGIARQQMKFALLGGVVGIVLSTFSTILALTFPLAPSTQTQAWMIAGTNILSAFGFTATLAGLLVSMLRYRLYDVDLFISRSAAYAALTLMLGAAFAGSEKVIEVMGEEWLGESSKTLAAGASAAIAATLIAPLRGRIHHWAEHRFQSGLATIKSKLPKRIADMREYAGLNNLLDVALAGVAGSVRASRSAILLLRSSDGFEVARTRGAPIAEARAWAEENLRVNAARLEQSQDDALFPLRLRLSADGTGMIGWLVLGPRPDGSLYSSDQREAIASIADPLARAIEIVRHRTERDEAMTVRIDRLERELADLKALQTG